MRRSTACFAFLLIVLILASFATPSALPVSAPPAAAAPAPTAAEVDEPPATVLQNHSASQAISFVQIAAGDAHTCGLTNTGLVYCWGMNSSGQIGDGTTTNRRTPVAVSGLSGAIVIEAGSFHTCALLSNGTVRCWGSNYSGQLGDGTTTDRRTPVAASGLNGAVAITAGRDHTCALLRNGTVRCWGSNSFGQLGDGTRTRRLTPSAVSNLSSVNNITAGGFYTCASLWDGTARCWGLNSSGQLGDGTTIDRWTPVAVSNLSSANAIVAGDRHTCALLRNGTARCWGWNYFGQLGDGTTTDRRTPVAVSGLSGANAITTGDRHTCALLNDGTVRCWGANSFGQLGDGTTTTPRTPVAVSGLSDAVAITAGGWLWEWSAGGHTCAVLRNGAARCWGANSFGQLGDGTTTDRWTPTAVAGSGGGAPPRPLIFIPGIMGSRLEVKDNETWRELWPAATSLLDRNRIRNDYMTQLDSDRIIATDAVRKVLIKDIYRPLIEEFLVQQLGYREDRSDPQQQTPVQRCQELHKAKRTDVTLFVFAYDWRKPIERNAEELGRLIDCVRMLHNAPQVDLLAHSMGGLVAGIYAQNLENSVYVDKIITIATPWHGAPMMLMALSTGKGPLDWVSRQVVGVSTNDVMKWSRAFPGAHQLLPSRTYVDVYRNVVFEEKGWDVDNDGKDQEAYDTYDQLINMLNGNYEPAGTNAEHFSRTYVTNWRPAWSQVEYYTIYGDKGTNTTISKVEAQKIVRCYGVGRIRWCFPTYSYALKFAAGDATVPIDSASPQGWTTYLVDEGKTEHTELTKNPIVWDMIGRALALSGQLSAQEQVAGMLSAPAPAMYVTGIGFPALSVTDSFGNLVGSDGTLAVTDTVVADYYPLGTDAHALVFPAGETYTVTLRTGNGPFHLELTCGTGDSADLAVRYLDLSLPANISATLRITPQGIEPLRADTDGNGTFETEIPPTASVTGAAANDLDAPTLTISATGPLDAKTVTITAADSGAGVKRVLYSLDGTTFQPYTAPFVVDARQTPVVYAFADDNVANRSSLLTERLAWPTYLPLTVR